MSHLLHEWTQAMREGDYERAWALHEDGIASKAAWSRDDPALPYHLRWVWDGRDIAGRHTLVRCYHGLGDTIQFLRFLPALRRQAASVTLEIQPRLIPLLDGEPLADRIVPFDPARPQKPAECDIEIMELSFALHARPAAFAPPYLYAGRAAPDPKTIGKTIGLCTRAGEWDEERSLPPEFLMPLCEGRDCITLDPQPSPLPVRNPTGCPFDIAQTAALIAGAALVITVDTMVAHLAGAMNRPTWLLLKHEPDWRWAPASGRSEWYPSMRLYAQPTPGDWTSVVAAVRRDLADLMPQQCLRHG
jgi:hypothetical protein